MSEFWIGFLAALGAMFVFIPIIAWWGQALEPIYECVRQYVNHKLFEINDE